MRNALLVVAAAVMIAVAAVAPAQAAKAKTDVTISAFNWDNPPFLIGEVKSKKTSCAKARKVTLFRVRGGSKEKMGSTKTISGEGTWAWIIEAPGAEVGDVYYAQASATKSCRGDKSGDYEVIPF